MSNESYHSMSNRFPAFFTCHIYEKMSLFLFHILARDAFLPRALLIFTASHTSQ